MRLITYAEKPTVSGGEGARMISCRPEKSPAKVERKLNDM